MFRQVERSRGTRQARLRPREGAAANIHVQAREDVRLSVQNDLFMGVPIFYYFESEKGGEFLAYKNVGETEEVQLVESASVPSYIYSPIIHVLKLPRILEHKKEFHQKFLAAEVADLPSLVKLATYKMLYEEPPLPLYCFKNGTSWIIGSFARLDDYEEASLFFYTQDQGRADGWFREVLADQPRGHRVQQEGGRARVLLRQGHQAGGKAPAGGVLVGFREALLSSSKTTFEPCHSRP